MKKTKYDTDSEMSILNEQFIPYSRQEEYEAVKRRQAILMSDEEKFRMFCRMLKRGVMFKRAVITHKKPNQ
ncbi:MAG: hypothetical protein IPK31_04725 [Chitinophagaceae bacterium]|nr:hypothetical protein [Chitinophagaceae bacterium]